MVQRSRNWVAAAAILAASITLLWPHTGEAQSGLRRNEQQRNDAHSRAAVALASRTPDADAALSAYLRRLPRWPSPIPGTEPLYLMGDVPLTRAEIREQLFALGRLANSNPCTRAIDNRDKPTLLFDQCLARFPFVERDGDKFYVFQLTRNEVQALSRSQPALIDRGQEFAQRARNKNYKTVLDPETQLQAVIARDQQTQQDTGQAPRFFIYARCNGNDDCAETVRLVQIIGRRASAARSMTGRSAGALRTTARSLRNSRLVVHARGGSPQFWSADFRRLRYAVIRSTFPSKARYDATVNAMRSAGAAWQRVCPKCSVIFEHDRSLDGIRLFREFLRRARLDIRKQPGGLRFVVMYRRTGSAIATAFFPDAPSERRIINVLPGFFMLSRSAQNGVMRHELGHVLGYRHEQIRLFVDGSTKIGECEREAFIRPGVDWIAQTKYDRFSVMHYDCATGGLPRLQITRFDRLGHRKIYSLASPASITPNDPETLQNPATPRTNPAQTDPGAAPGQAQASPVHAMQACHQACRKAQGNSFDCLDQCTCEAQCSLRGKPESCKNACLRTGG